MAEGFDPDAELEKTYLPGPTAKTPRRLRLSSLVAAILFVLVGGVVGYFWHQQEWWPADDEALGAACDQLDRFDPLAKDATRYFDKLEEDGYPLADGESSLTARALRAAQRIRNDWEDEHQDDFRRLHFEAVRVITDTEIIQRQGNEYAPALIPYFRDRAEFWERIWKQAGSAIAGETGYLREPGPGDEAIRASVIADRCTASTGQPF